MSGWRTRSSSGSQWEMGQVIQHTFGDGRALREFIAIFRRFSPQVTLDVISYSYKTR